MMDGSATHTRFGKWLRGGETLNQRLVVTCILLLSAFVVVRDGRHYYFFSDDFLNFIIASDMGLTWAYLFRDVFGQWIPLHRLSNLIYWHCFGLRFWPFRVLQVLFSSLAIILVARIATRQRVGLVVVVPALALLAFSPIFVTAYQWWSAALSVLTSALASLAAISLAAGTPTLGTGRKLGIAAFFLAGLLFYPKGLFTVVLIVAIRMFVNVKALGTQWRPAILRSAGDIWPTAVVSIAYLAIVKVGHYSSGVMHPDAPMLLRFVSTGWNGGFVAGVLGLNIDSTSVLVSANLLLIALVIWSAARDRRTLILWAGFFVYFLLSVTVIGWNRAVPFGVESALTGHYYADMLCFFVATLLIAFGNETSGSRRSIPALQAAMIVMATIAGSAHLIAASMRVTDIWNVGPSKPSAFVGHVQSALANLPDDAKIENSQVPTYVMPQWTWPLNKYQYFLPLFGWRGRVVPLADASVSFDDAGNLVTRRR